MKPHNGDTGFALRLWYFRRPWLRPLQVATIALALLALPIAAGPTQATPAAAAASTGHATPAAVAASTRHASPAAPGPAAAAPAAAGPGAHVYLVRGIFNIFSLGMDQIADKLQRQGIPATVHNHMNWGGVADDAVAQYKSGRAKTIILVGHSSGATVLPDIVARMSQQGVPVKLAIGLDSVFRTSLEGHVGRYINFYIANGAGTPVAPTRNLHGALENVDVQNIPGIGHTSIDKNQIMQQKVISAIDAVVLNRPKEPSAAQPSLEPSAAKPSTGTTSAAAAPAR